MSGQSPVSDPQRFEAALTRFDEANAADPTSEELPEGPRPRELAYAQWLTDWVLKLKPDASEELRLAARCQHLCRWMLPRTSYPMTRAGYLRWREELRQFHARRAGEILREVGYPESLIARVQELNLKKGFPMDPEARILEDALCLVFLERQFGALAAKLPDDKMANAVGKSWAKMTPAGQQMARQLHYSAREREILERILGNLPDSGGSPDQSVKR